MIEIMPESQGKVAGVKVSGKITAKEYEDVVIARLDDIIKEHGKARFLWYLDEGFQGAEAGAVWDDAKFAGFSIHSSFSARSITAGDATGQPGVESSK